LLKTDPFGNILWLKTAGGTDLNHGSIATDIAVKSTNDLVISGCFSQNANFDSISINCLGFSDAFLAKYNNLGHCLWVAKMGGSSTETAQSISITNDQSILVCGIFSSSTAYFDTILLHHYNSPYSNKLFIAKYSNNGKCIWAKQASKGLSNAKKVTNINSQIYVTGYYQDSITIENETDLTSNITDANIFIASYDMNGNLKWLKSAGGLGTDIANSISVDILGNCYITGYFEDTATFGTQSIITGSSNRDMFFAKYDSSGNFIWVKQLYSSGGAEGKDIFSDGNNGFYVTGYFSGTALFGTYSMNSLTPNDMFIAHYDNNGNFLGVRNVANATGYGISLDTGGNCIITGTFTSSTLFDGINLVSHGDDDIFLAKMDTITGMPDKFLQNDKLVIYANPTTGKCNITVPDDLVNEPNLVLCVYDNMGKLIQRQNLTMEGDKIKLSLEAEAKGIYTATLSNGKKIYRGKIVLE
jgi:hypothetical protein